MGYDLHLFRPRPGMDLVESGRHSFRFEGDPPATPEADARKQALADALIAHDPGLRILSVDAEFEARQESTVPPPLEVATGDGSGILISVFDLTVGLSFPYRHPGDDGVAVWDRVRGYLRVLEAAGGFRTYDPQIEAVLDPAQPSPDAETSYHNTVAFVQSIAATFDPAPARKPWWKFW